MSKSGILSNFWLHNNHDLLVLKSANTDRKCTTVQIKSPLTYEGVMFPEIFHSFVVQNIWLSHRKKIMGWSETFRILGTLTGPSLQRLAPGQKVVEVKELGCVPEVFLGCHTTGRSRASRYDHFSYTENQSNMHGQHDLQNSYLLKE